MSTPPTVLVTGANGYIGNAVARAFTTAGYKTYGLIRSPTSAASLSAAEITPIIGSANDLSFLPALYNYTKTFDIIVTASEDWNDWLAHYNATIHLLRDLAKTSLENGVRSLVIFTSGCKDYGMTPFHESAGLAPHTEVSPLNPPSFLRVRTENALGVFNHTDFFDGVVTRPSTMYGLTSSYYKVLFEAAEAAAAEGGVLHFPADENSIMHGTHVSDVAAAYLAIAEAPRGVVKGQVYNISGRRYETLREVGDALAAEYEGVQKVSYTPGAKFEEGGDFLGKGILMSVAGFSQWVGSEKLRTETGWKDVRGLFSEEVGIYRRAFEASR